MKLVGNRTPPSLFSAYTSRWLLTVLFCLLLTACVAPQAAPTADTQPATSSEGRASASSGQLVVYTSRSEALFKPVIEAFNKLYPDVQITMLSGKNGELAAKILEEQNNPQADLFVSTDTLTMISLDASDGFQANDSASVQAVPIDYRAENGNWVTLTLRPRVIMYNSDLVKPEDAPQSVFDLLDPKWQGSIGAADSTNGAMMAHLAVIRHLQGEEKMVEWVQGLVNNGTQFFGSHTDVRKAVGAGELKVGLVNHYYYHLSKAEGAPVAVVYPDQDEQGIGLVVNSTNAGIVKGSPHAEAAKQFIDFMLSPEGQKIYADLNYEYPIVSGVALAEGVPPLSNFKLSNVSLKTMWEELGATSQAALGAGLP